MRSFQFSGFPIYRSLLRCRREQQADDNRRFGDELASTRLIERSLELFVRPVRASSRFYQAATPRSSICWTVVAVTRDRMRSQRCTANAFSIRIITDDGARESAGDFIFQINEVRYRSSCLSIKFSLAERHPRRAYSFPRRAPMRDANANTSTRRFTENSLLASLALCLCRWK